MALLPASGTGLRLEKKCLRDIQQPILTDTIGKVPGAVGDRGHKPGHDSLAL